MFDQESKIFNLGRIHLKVIFTKIVFTEIIGRINTTNYSPLNQFVGFLSRLVVVKKKD